MTEEPYRWLEAVANRRDYVREQLKGGSPVFAACLADGILLLGVGGGQSKVFELFDRHALAGLGHPADIEKLRQAAIDAAHLEAFTRAPEDVSLRRLVGFGISPQLKTSFEQIFSAPFLVELIFAEVGAKPGQDLVTRLRFDGGFQNHTGGVVVAAAASEPEKAAQAWLNSVITAGSTRSLAAESLLQAWWCVQEGKSLNAALPSEAERREGWRRAVDGRTVEIGWLQRGGPGRAKFVPLELPSLGL